MNNFFKKRPGKKDLTGITDDRSPEIGERMILSLLI
jgi:hypothetical protein